MALAFETLIAAGDGTDRTSYDTASVSPAAERVLLLAIGQQLSAADPVAGPVSGLGLTWTQVGSVLYDNAGTFYRFSVYRAYTGATAPTPGVITIGNGSTLYAATAWILDSVSGAKVTGTNAADAILQTVIVPATPPSVGATSNLATLAAFGDSANRPWSAFTWEANEAAGTVESGWTYGTRAFNTANAQSIQSQWADNADTTASGQWTTSVQHAHIAVEVVAAPGVPPQYARPASTQAIGTWVDLAGGTTDIHLGLDETTASDSDGVKSQAGPTGANPYEAGLSSVTDPVSSTGHNLRVRARSDGGAGGALSLTAELRQGANALSTPATLTPALTTSFQSFLLALSAAQADAITDYSTLRTRLTASQAAAPDNAMPAWQATGSAVSATTAALTVVWPAHIADDVALLFIETNGGAASPTLSTPAGFTQVTNSPQSTGTGTAGTKLSVFWCRATSGAMTSPVIAASTDHLYALIVTFRGCATAVSPINITSGGVKAGASTTTSTTGVTTTVNNCLIVEALTKDLDASQAFASAQTNNNLSSITERADAGTTSGTGGGIAVHHGGKATAGATGATSITVTSSISAFMTIALAPPAPATNAGRVEVSWIELEVPGVAALTATVAGNQPAATGILSRIRLAAVGLTGAQPSGTGISAAIKAAAVALVGDQPSATGVLNAARAIARALTGAQPAASATITRSRLGSSTLTGAQLAATALLSRTRAGTSALVGTQPAGTGVAARFRAGASALVGTQPAPTGVASSARATSRSASGTQPGASATISPVKQAFRPLTGAQPAGSGVLTRVRFGVVGLVGAQPTASAVLTRLAHYQRSLLGTQPSGSGLLAVSRAAQRAAAGVQPAATGTLTDRLLALKSLTGAQPAPTAVVTGRKSSTRTLAGAQLAAAGVVTKVRVISRTAAGVQPTATGILTDRLLAVKSLLGAQPSSTAAVTARKFATKALLGTQPAGSGQLGVVTGGSRTLTGVQPVGSGLLGIRLSLYKSLTGAQPAGSGILSQTKRSWRVALGVQPSATGVLNRTAFLQRSVVGLAPAASGVLVGQKQAYAVLSGSQLAPTGTLTAFLAVGYPVHKMRAHLPNVGFVGVRVGRGF